MKQINTAKLHSKKKKHMPFKELHTEQKYKKKKTTVDMRISWSSAVELSGRYIYFLYI